jgi:hypothetical protein
MLLAVETTHDELRQRVQQILDSYPNALSHVDGEYLVTARGVRLLKYDGQRKRHSRKLLSTDIEDAWSQVYPASCAPRVPVRNFDPGCWPRR